jgi:hypothetical protein
MSTINFTRTITLKEAADLIVSVPENVVFIRGEPGIGKSSLMEMLKRLLPGHAMGYIDCGNMDLGDTAMPVVSIQEMITYYAPNSRFHLSKTSTQPVVIMLDEFTKAPLPVQNMLHPLLERHNPRLGDLPLPPGSIVFMTGNMASDGVNDNLKSHSQNRIVEVVVAKPTSDEWVYWAVAKGTISAPVILWAQEHPEAFASYMDEGQDENAYIFNPRKVQKGFVSPRSLEAASYYVEKRDRYSNNALYAALSGAAGPSFAASMDAFIAYEDELPKWVEIVANPATALIPESPGACATLVFGAIQKVEKDTFTAFMTYAERLSSEWQAVFAVNVAKNRDKQAIALSNPTFAAWLAANEDIL